ncbi:PLAT domain-containing protein 1 [Asimina triloba]
MPGVKPIFIVVLTCIFSLLTIPALASPVIITKGDDYNCVYVVYIRTGSVWKGGTDSIIGLTLYDASGHGLNITNLEAWGGLMGSGYNYYERGNLDMFSGRGPCVDSPICAVNLFSDGSGDHHGWYCNYVEVTSTGPHVPCNQQLFTVEQWLALDTSPYQLSTTRNNCPKRAADPSDARISSVVM